LNIYGFIFVEKIKCKARQMDFALWYVLFHTTVLVKQVLTLRKYQVWNTYHSCTIWPYVAVIFLKPKVSMKVSHFKSFLKIMSHAWQAYWMHVPWKFLYALKYDNNFITLTQLFWLFVMVDILNHMTLSHLTRIITCWFAVCSSVV
jgi:hypothetical protein